MPNPEGHPFPRRPGRLQFVYSSTPAYYVTFCTFNRQPLLANVSVHEAFRTGAKKAAESGSAVGRYVLMPDHVHCFLRIGHGGGLGLTVKRLKEGISKCLRNGNPGLHVWQSGYFDHVLRNRESYSEKWEYVRQNPVRAELCRVPEEWPYQGEITDIFV